jgi:tuftelin-interacting protein 11
VQRSRSSTPGAPKPNVKADGKKKHHLATETSFRSIVEDFAAENNLIFMHTGKSHETTGQPLFKISAAVDDKKGLVVYLQDDIVWAQEGSSWAPISVGDMVAKAQKL